MSDEGNAIAGVYSIDTSQIAKTGIAPIDYAGIETLNLETGTDSDTVVVLDTLPATATSLSTGGGSDRVTINDSGVDAIVRLDSGADNDQVFLDETGNGSVTLIATGTGDDDISVTTTGDDSGLMIEAGSDNDVVLLSATGANAATTIELGDGNDIGNVQSTSTGSFTEIAGGLDNDTVNLSSDANGDRANPSGSSSGDLNGFLGNLALDGEDNLMVPENAASVTAKTSTITVSIPVGDVLNLIDAGNATPETYTLDTMTVTRTGLPPINYATFETLNIETGSDVDTFDILTTAASTSVTVETFDGNDIVTVTTTGDDGILTVDSGIGDDNIAITTTGDRSVSRFFTDEGADDVSVTTTGSDSGLEIQTGDQVDLVTLVDVGPGAATVLGLGEGDDIANVRGTATGSLTDLFAGAGNDTINVSSDANGDRLDPDGNLNGNLDEILGDLCVEGEADSSPDTNVAQAEGRQTDGDVVTVTATTNLGDELNLSDQSSITDNTYALDADEFQRTAPVATGTLFYGTIESLNIETGSGSDNFSVLATADATSFRLETLAGNDEVNVATTGLGSIVSIETNDGTDTVGVASTGDASVVVVDTGLENDTLSIESIGDAAGISATTGLGDDTVTLDAEPSPSTRATDAVIGIDAGEGEDDFIVEEVYLQTVVDLQGGDDNDEFTLVAGGSDSGGYLGRLNDDPGTDPSDDTVARTRQLFLDGGNNGGATSTVLQGVTLSAAANPEPVFGSEPAIEDGDTVRIDASASSTPLDLRYAITGPAEGVLASTVPATPRATAGNEVFETLGIENVDIVTGADNDLLTVSSDVALDVTQTATKLSFDGGAGSNRFEVIGTPDADEITLGDLGGDLEPFELENVDFARVDAGAGDDQVVNNTSITSVLNGLEDSDLIVGGFGQDLITGGAGVDFIFGRAGNDVLLVDQDLGNDSPFIEAGEIIDGDTEDAIPNGDVCVQFDADAVRNCELLGDGGGIKDVLTWLRGIIVDPSEIRFTPLSPVFDAFVPAFPDPVEILAVTEPSKLPFSASLAATSPRANDATDQYFATYDPRDTNRDGRIGISDALFVINRLAAADSSEGLIKHVKWWIRETADVDNDGYIRVRDALLVINHLATPTGKLGSGEETPESLSMETIDEVDVRLF